MRSLILYLYSICASDMHTLRKGSCLRIWRRAAGGRHRVTTMSMLSMT